MRERSIALVLVVCAASGVQVLAGDWSWPGRFTEESSDELEDLHARILSGATLTEMGVTVHDVVWHADAFDLHMIDGAIFPEPAIDGCSCGALFVGKGSVTFTPGGARARSDLQHFFGTPSLDAEPISFAYFFTLAGTPLEDQLAIAGEATVPPDPGGPYATSKKAMRQLGAELTHAFLNRNGRSKGAAWVLFAPDSIRGAGHEDAHLLYSFDPQRQNEVSLEIFGHPDAIRDPRARPFLDRYPAYKYQFWNVTYVPAQRPVFKPQGKAGHYATHLTIGKSLGGVEETTKITFVPSEGVAALRLSLTPRLKVKSVTGPDGTSYPFVQWKYRADDPLDFDAYVVVFTGELPSGVPFQLDVVSDGPLFDAELGSSVLADEDNWYPRLNDPGDSTYELFCSLPKNMDAVGAGEVVSDEIEGGTRKVHFRTTQPAKRTTFYYGDYETYQAKADDTEVTLFTNSLREEINRATVLDDSAPDVMIPGGESPKYTVNEVANAVKIYNRILGHPLEVAQLRVATTPTSHGRGFEGLILLSRYGGTSAEFSAADFFRAHEVAHQWWGNMVDGRSWPDDRWLSESLAEYMAMEYYQARFQKPDKTLQQVQERWVKPLFKSSTETAQTLTGTTRQVDLAELEPLIAGGENVYTKGPLVVGMLRYLFQIQKKNDDAFWALLGDFIETYKYSQASTQDFMNMTEDHLQGKLGWFWDQWFYGTAIPVVKWSHDVRKNEEGDWVVTVEAEQQDTEFVLAIPIYLHMGGDRTLTTPLILRGRQGRAQARMHDKPAKVTLNDNWEALVELRN
jgi:hypothetical protein